MLNIAAARLLNQQLAHPSMSRVADMVRWLGAVQAQEYHGGRWSVGVRIPGSTDADLEAAFADKSIVRAFFMRGTIHIVPGADLRWMLPLISDRPRRMFKSTAKYNQTGLTDADFVKGDHALVRALEGGKQLIRDEMKQALIDAGIATSNMGYMLLMQHAQTEGLVCYGLNRGKQQTFTLLDEWLPPAPLLDREAGIAEFARRFFASHGPATLHDFANWAGIPIGEAKTGVEAVKSEFATEVIDGKTYYFAPVATRPAIESPNVHLLPTFDEFFIGYKDRSAFMSPEHGAIWAARVDHIVAPVVIDGRGAGLWWREIKKNAMIFHVDMFAPTSPALMSAVHAAARNYADYLGLEAIFA